MSKPRVKTNSNISNKQKIPYGNIQSNININGNSIYYNAKPIPAIKNKNLAGPISSNDLLNDNITAISMSEVGGTFGQEQVIPIINTIPPITNNLSPQPHLENMDDAIPITDDCQIFAFLKKSVIKAITKPKTSWLAKLLNNYILIIVFASVMTMCFETVNEFRINSYQQNLWKWLECFYTINLTLDYIIRLATYPYRSHDATTKSKRGKRAKLKKSIFKKYTGFFDINSVVDLLGTIPYYLEVIFPKLAYQQVDENSWLTLLLRIFRDIRLLRLIYGTHSTTSEKIKLVVIAFKRSKDGLIMVLWLFSILVIFFSSILFFSEVSQCELDMDSQVNQYIYIYIF